MGIDQVYEELLKEDGYSCGTTIRPELSKVYEECKSFTITSLLTIDEQ